MPIFVEPSNPLLQKPVEEVRIEDIPKKETQDIIEYMFQIARGERTDLEKRVLIGLAAPQVGIYKRIILVDIGVDKDRLHLSELKLFINPKILWRSEEKEEGRELCYSVDNHIAGIVSRPKRIKFSAYDAQGNPFSGELTEMAARIFQHETDHLDGIRFPERIGENEENGKLHWLKEGDLPLYRKHWQTWEVKCPWSTWLAVKEGRPIEAPE